MRSLMPLLLFSERMGTVVERNGERVYLCIKCFETVSFTRWGRAGDPGSHSTPAQRPFTRDEEYWLEFLQKTN